MQASQRAACKGSIYSLPYLTLPYSLHATALCYQIGLASADKPALEEVRQHYPQVVHQTTIRCLGIALGMCQGWPLRMRFTEDCRALIPRSSSMDC